MATITGYKCPNCGADIPFDPNAQNLKCQHCGTEYSIETLSDYNQAILQKSDSYEWGDYKAENLTLGEVEYTCPSCGGSVIMDKDNSATACPYCGSAVILSDKLSGSLKPDLVIPFKLDKASAIEALKKELSGKFLLPSDFKHQKYLDKLEGVYIPYWLFDCDADCNARFRMTRIEHWSSGDYRYTKTSHYMAIRDGQMEFEKVPVDASLKLEADLLEALEPFDYQSAVDFNTAYLAGFFADVRQEDEEVCKQRANERIHNSMVDTLASSVLGYSTCILESSAINFADGKVHYALLPVYLLSKSYKGKVYTLAINGQNGRIAGDLPRNYPKLAIYAIAIFVACSLLVAFLAYFLIGV